MAKDRQAVTCNGRPAFYACMWEDIRQCAMDCGWAVSLHGSLASDMDIMAMPWVENAVSFKEMVDRVSKLFKDNELSSQYVITYNDKPHNRVVATIPIFSDFYLDISTIKTAEAAPEVEELIYKLECLLCHATGGLLSKRTYDLRKMESAVTDYVEKCCDEARAEAKDEVAREIFAEIEREFCGAYWYKGYTIERYIAELKKKYTEEQHDE